MKKFPVKLFSSNTYDPKAFTRQIENLPNQLRKFEIDYSELKIPGAICYAHIGYWKVLSGKEERIPA